MKKIYQRLMAGILMIMMLLFISFSAHAADEENPMESLPEETDSEIEIQTEEETEAISETIRKPTAVWEIGPLGQEKADNISPMAAGQVGTTWGMYALLTEPLTVEAFGPYVTDPYSHIIQTGPTFSEETRTAYCIEYGVACPPGSYPTESESFTKQQNYLGYALHYGWRQTGNTYDESQYDNPVNRTEYLVTQAVIWACTFDLFGTEAGDQAIQYLAKYSYAPEHAAEYYEKLKKQILEAEKIPSFSGASREDAPEILLRWDHENARYEATVTDEHGVLDRFDYQCDGVSVIKNKHTLTFFTTEDLSDAIMAEAVHTAPGGAGAVVVWDGESGSQDLATYREASVDVVSYIRLRTEGHGAIEIQKASANMEITENNGCYRLEGAVYGVYREGVEVGRITTDKDGKGRLDDLKPGNYQLKELTAPRGYEVDAKSYDAVVLSDQISSVKVQDVPKMASVSLLLEKMDLQTGKNQPQGTATFTGAEFTVQFFDGMDGEKPMRTWVLKTNEAGQCYLSDEYKVSGDDFYLWEGQPALPLGVVVIQETKAPEGYLKNEEIFNIPIGSDTSGDDVILYQYPQIPEQVIRGDFEFLKHTSDGEGMAHIPFEITALETGETHTVYSDEQGRVSTKDLWFGDGGATEKLGGLPYGIYRVEELPCVGNEDKILAEAFEVKVDQHLVTLDLGIVENSYRPFPELDSVAVGRETGIHSLPAESGVAILETLECKNLFPSVPFTLKVKAVDAETGEVLVIDDKEQVKMLTFVAQEANETKEFLFEFSAVGLQGKKITLTAELFRRGKIVAVHNLDHEDMDQTVSVTEMGISTKAMDPLDGDKIVNFGDMDSEITVLDQISYEDFLPGRTYQVVSALADRVTGKIITELPPKEFTPEAADGIFEAEICLDGKELDGREVVVYETIYDSGGKVIAEEKDIQNEAQMVTLKKVRISTKATDKLDGDKKLVNEAQMIIKDEVAYTNLTPGKTYEISGILMWADRNEPLVVNKKEVRGKTVFTPKTADGTADVFFSLDATALQGKKLVVFESLYDGDGKLLAEHKDIKDEGQTLEVEEIRIKTTAAEKQSGKKKVRAEGVVQIADQVSYENLVPGRKYRLEGCLMDAMAGEPLLINGKSITGAIEFIPKEAKGSVEVVFEFNSAALGNQEIVVFEKLYNANGAVAAVHEDLHDRGQTVTFEKPEDSPKTGDSTSLFPLLGAAGISGGILLGFFIKSRKKTRKKLKK